MTAQAPQTFTVTLDDGATTQVDCWGSFGPLLLCVHGMTSSRKSWERLALHLAGRYRVVAYDQRGHGDSSRVSGPMTLERCRRDLANVVRALDETPYALIGHSWGGAVVLLGGRTLAVDKVVAIDPMLGQCDDQWYAEFLDDIAPIFALQGDARAEKVRADYADWPDIDRERKIHAVATMDAGPIQRLRDENTYGDWNLRETIANYPHPLLMAIADPSESIIEPADFEFLKAHGGKNLRTVIFANQGHNLHRTDFDHFTNVLNDFL